MKKKIALTILTLFATTAIAGAAEQDLGRRKLYEFNFDCSFTQELEGSDVSIVPPPVTHKALAKVFAWVDTDDWMSTMESVRHISNKLTVYRVSPTELIYADGAFLDPDHRFVTIKGLGGLPVIRVKRYDHESVVTPSTTYYDATLRLHHSLIRGSCSVTNSPVHRAELN